MQDEQDHLVNHVNPVILSNQLSAARARPVPVHALLYLRAQSSISSDTLHLSLSNTAQRSRRRYNSRARPAPYLSTSHRSTTHLDAPSITALPTILVTSGSTSSFRSDHSSVSRTRVFSARAAIHHPLVRAGKNQPGLMVLMWRLLVGNYRTFRTGARFCGRRSN